MNQDNPSAIFVVDVNLWTGMGRDLPGDREGAEQVYRQSLEMFTEMGAPGYIKVLEQLLGGIDTKSIPS